MRRPLLLVIMLAITIVVFYLSQFWFLNLWPRSGLFGIEALRPDGGLLARWLRGTQFAPFALLIWAIGVFLLLTYLERFVAYISTLTSPKKEADHD